MKMTNKIIYEKMQKRQIRKELIKMVDLCAFRLHDIGLEQYDTASLYVELLTPTLFLIVCNIQVHYLHRPLLDVIQTSALLYVQMFA